MRLSKSLIAVFASAITLQSVSVPLQAEATQELISKPNLHPTIAVVDLNDYKNPSTRDKFIADVAQALYETGFFALVNPGVDQATIDSAYAASKDFFDLPRDEKYKIYKPELSGQRGYIPSETAKGSGKKDFKEFLHIGHDNNPEFGSNLWPDSMDLRGPMVSLYTALEEAMRPLEEAFSLALHQNKDFIGNMTRTGDSLMRPIHYPGPCPAEHVWAAEHTDINLYTILPKASRSGLQIKLRSGEWIDVVTPENCFIINAGDMIECLSNGLFHAGPHRVVDDGSAGDRYSIVFFVHPGASDDLTPLSACVERTGGKALYASTKRLPLLAERLAELGLASPFLIQVLAESQLEEQQIELGRASVGAMQALRAAGLASERVQAELAARGV